MIWFDLDNSPHIPLFRPIFSELQSKNSEYFITARDFAQTKDLLNYWEIPFRAVGNHGGKNKMLKIINLAQRSRQLLGTIKNQKINLAVSHGSRTQFIAAKFRHIKSLVMLDYEFTEHKIFNLLADHILIPKFIPDERLYAAGFNLNKIIRYKGFKEELYISRFIPEPNFRNEIDVSDDNVLIVLRPPSMVGNYSNSHSQSLFISAIKYFSTFKNTIILIVNRTDYEKKYLLSHFNLSDQIRILDKPVDGLQLLYAADIAVSGGGTMNREAALLGTETYSIFKGKRPYLDEYLEVLGRLKFINSVKDFKKIQVEKKENKVIYPYNKNLASSITDILLSFT